MHEAAARTIAFAEPTPDLILDRFRILTVMGEGGFAQVLNCWDTRLQRRVAIKRMPLSYGSFGANSSILNEALSEARTSCLLAHPNIVRVLDFEQDAQFAYLVMEYIDGVNLADFLQRVEDGTLTQEETSYLIKTLGSALNFAHENGVLHLDIKPSNILIHNNGTISLCDFGMASLASAAGYEESRGGTLGYMPPEQLTEGICDERSDVFALGCVVYQALTSETPFLAADAQSSLSCIQRMSSTKLRKSLMHIPAEAQDLLISALQPEVEQRPARVDEWAQDLSQALGSPHEGKQSIAELMGQTLSDEQAESPRTSQKLDLNFRYPQLKGMALRLATAIIAMLMCYQLLPSFLYATDIWGISSQLQLFDSAGLSTNALLLSSLQYSASACMFVLAFLLPNIGAATIALLFGSSTAIYLAKPLFVVISAALTLVFVLLLHKYRRSTSLLGASLLIGASTSCPSASPLLASYAFSQLRPALACSLFSYVYALFVNATLSSRGIHAAFNAEHALELFFHSLTQPHNLLLAAALCALAAVTALLAGFLHSKSSEFFLQLGSTVLAIMLTASTPYLLALHAFNPSQGLPLPPHSMDIPQSFNNDYHQQLLLVLLLGITMCIAAAMFGRPTKR